MGQRFFEDSNALDSLRSSDFDAYSAYGEVIDNSIQAGATKIYIKFDAPLSGKYHYRPINNLAFSDNGSGMDARVIASCLKLGWSSRFNDRSGIGRFGVGMVLGAIHECKRIEVYSKQAGTNEWLWTYIDLDEVESRQMETIPDPIAREIPIEYEDIIDQKQGTLVVWSKYDRQKESADKIITETHDYIGQTFRKFIWDGVDIHIDGEDVKAHDPLFLRTDKTRFPSDPTGTTYPEFTIDWPIKDKSLHRDFGETSKVTVRMSILPEQFRLTRGSGGSKAAKDRKINTQQEGVSILREGREVFSGPIAYWSNVKTGQANKRSWRFEEIDRWWGCEIEFGAELDASFEVKNIKRGARPEAELLVAIKEKIGPTRASVIEQVQGAWKKADDVKRDEENKAAAELKRHESHAKTEKAAAKAISTISKFDANVSAEQASEKHFEQFGEHFEKTQAQRYKELFKAQPYTIVDDHKGWRGGTFWETTMAGNKIMMHYNLQHEFFTQIRMLEEIISEETDLENLKDHSIKITAFIDLLLTSYAKTQSSFDREQEFKVEDFFEIFNQNWGQILNSFVKSWKETE